jgi:hypothetical protein
MPTRTISTTLLLAGLVAAVPPRVEAQRDRLAEGDGLAVRGE